MATAGKLPPPPAPVRALMTGGLDEAGAAALARHGWRLLQRRDAAAGDALVALLHEIAGRSTARAAAGMACRKGCAFCCHQHVSAHAIEIFALARRRRQPVPAPAGRRCAFLGNDSACTIHADRPLACRLVVSADARACEASLADPAIVAPWPRQFSDTAAWMVMALWAGQRALGLPVRGYALVPALAAVMADPGLEARWYAGDDGLAAFSTDADRPQPAMLAAADRLAGLARLQPE
jgi:hypothetical protein